MVLCFSGTGNSRFVAERIAEHTNDTLVDITSYCGSAEPKKMGGSSLYPGYANYNVDFGIKLRISDKVDDNNIKDGINIGVIMHWC